MALRVPGGLGVGLQGPRAKGVGYRVSGDQGVGLEGVKG